MYGIMTKISSVSSQNQLLMLKNAPEFTKIMIGEICTSFLTKCRETFFLCIGTVHFLWGRGGWWDLVDSLCSI